MMILWKKNIFVMAIRARMEQEGRTAADIIDEYVKLTQEEREEIISSL